MMFRPFSSLAWAIIFVKVKVFDPVIFTAFLFLFDQYEYEDLYNMNSFIFSTPLVTANIEQQTQFLHHRFSFLL